MGTGGRWDFSAAAWRHLLVPAPKSLFTARAANSGGRFAIRSATSARAATSICPRRCCKLLVLRGLIPRQAVATMARFRDVLGNEKVLNFQAVARTPRAQAKVR